MPAEQEITAGEAQRIGPPTAEPSRIVYRFGNELKSKFVPMKDHSEALKEIIKIFSENNVKAPEAIVHRLVHGGNVVKDNSVITDDKLSLLENLKKLAPIHNPPAISAIHACKLHFPAIPQIIISDTAFHSTIPDFAAVYALPKKRGFDKGFRKYGFHGISHEYVVNEGAKFLKIPLEEFNCVSCHLGSGGASLCAVKKGKSIDNTMGYSPLPGLIMSTRCGDIDPGIVIRLLSEYNMNVMAVEGLLNRKSGVLGLSARSADIRDAIKGAIERKHERDFLALQIYLWRLKKYLGSYLTITGDVHAVIFTDTIGEFVPEVRQVICSGMDVFGIQIDEIKNKKASLPCDIAADSSQVRLLVIATNEEISMARSAYKLLAA